MEEMAPTTLLPSVKIKRHDSVIFVVKLYLLSCLILAARASDRFSFLHKIYNVSLVHPLGKIVLNLPD